MSCYKCGKKFNPLDEMTWHRTENGNKKTWTCSKCFKEQERI